MIIWVTTFKISHINEEMWLRKGLIYLFFSDHEDIYITLFKIFQELNFVANRITFN